MNSLIASAKTPDVAEDSLPTYQSILIAVDSSSHSDRATLEAVGLAKSYGAALSAAHVYAAKLHDQRFRQMEGGLPEQFRMEEELEHQREVHEDLIAKGLSIITDSYLDQVQKAAGNIPVKRRSLEGKNYRELVKEANSGGYDLLVMGALGLGAVQSSRIGTVASRVARRSAIDLLIVKEPTRALSSGPILVALDGSPKSYGALLSALSLAKAWGCEVKAISAFDPYYHYVAFNSIARVLSEEAGKIFRFQEQEKLHEEIIDSGLAKIYQGHLAVAQAIASDHGMTLETILLDGKPQEVIARYVRETNPSLLVMGVTGIHADLELDIGGNTEHLLQEAACALLLSQRQHHPQINRLASVNTSWTKEAEARLARAPSFVQSMARMAILRYAQERGHTVITESIVKVATATLMPRHAEEAIAEIVSAKEQGLIGKPTEVMRWSDGATRRLLSVKELALRGNLSMRAEKKARAEGKREVEEGHILAFLQGMDTSAFAPGSEAVANHQRRVDQDCTDPSAPRWSAAALARLMRVPEGFMRESAKQTIEEHARNQGAVEITLAVAEAGLAEARKAMEQQMSGNRP